MVEPVATPDSFGYLLFLIADGMVGDTVGGGSYGGRIGLWIGRLFEQSGIDCVADDGGSADRARSDFSPSGIVFCSEWRELLFFDHGTHVLGSSVFGRGAGAGVKEV